MKTGRERSWSNACVRERRRVATSTRETIETSSLATLTARLGDIYFIYLLIFRSFVRFARAFTVLDRL